MKQSEMTAAELEYFTIGNCYGGYQEWFTDPWMRLGGCAAVAACDSSIYFARQLGKVKLYPRNCRKLSKRDYVGFSQKMKPYLRPRRSGIDTLELYMDGYVNYLHDCGERGITMEGLHGSRPVEQADEAVRRQIDSGMPIPCLTLHHQSPNLKDYVWHWFLLTGYQQAEDTLLVKAVTYGSWRWLDFHELWDTGFEQKGGLVLYHMTKTST